MKIKKFFIGLICLTLVSCQTFLPNTIVNDSNGMKFENKSFEIKSTTNPDDIKKVF